MEKLPKLDEKKIPRANRGIYKKKRIVYRFTDMHMDLNVAYLLWMQAGGGADTAEIWAAISHMHKYDRENWQKSFAELALRLEQMGSKSLEQGHRVTAREVLFRSSCYYGTAGKRKKQVECFRRAGALVDPPVEPVAIPFEGKNLPGYFVKACEDDKRRKTLIFVGGGDTILEDLYFIIASAGVKRNWNVFVVEMPGQGVTAMDGMYQRPDAEVPMKAIVDYVLSRPDVDGEKLAAMGVSWGGYMVPRAACYEKRIKAIVANSIIPDGTIWMTEIAPFGTIAKLERSLLFPLIKLLFGSNLIPRLEGLKRKWGARDMQHFVDISSEFYLDPRMIECPTLLLDGELEIEYSAGVEILQELSLEAISHSNKKRITGPSRLGADGHCQVANSRYMTQVTFDWLDEVFENVHSKGIVSR